MARVTYVKKAQARYATQPVLNADGTPKRTPVMDKRTGQQKVSKRGPVFLTVTVADKTRPLPLLRCDACGEPIQLGTPYKHISPKSGPYGGTQRNRHAACPTWQVWDYSSSLSARLSQISYDFDREVESAADVDDFNSALENAATAIRELAEEKRESAQNIEDGFGHETSSSQELNEIADSLESWADEVEQADVPELPEPEDEDCDACSGTGEAEEESENGETPAVPCDTCDGTGQVTPDELSEDEISTWRDEAIEACAIVNESPV